MNANIKKIIIFLIISGVILFLFGFGLGIFYQTKTPKVQQLIKSEPTIKALGSKVVQSAVAFGNVKKIDGRKITLGFEGDEISINIIDNAQIFSSIPRKNPDTGKLFTGNPLVAQFKDIGLGDQITINFNIGADGQMQGNSVYIFSKAK